jgi:hypothetical protein
MRHETLPLTLSTCLTHFAPVGVRQGVACSTRSGWNTARLCRCYHKQNDLTTNGHRLPSGRRRGDVYAWHFLRTARAAQWRPHGVGVRSWGVWTVTTQCHMARAPGVKHGVPLQTIPRPVPPPQPPASALRCEPHRMPRRVIGMEGDKRVSIVPQRDVQDFS